MGPTHLQRILSQKCHLVTIEIFLYVVDNTSGSMHKKVLSSW